MKTQVLQNYKKKTKAKSNNQTLPNLPLLFYQTEKK